MATKKPKKVRLLVGINYPDSTGKEVRKEAGDVITLTSQLKQALTGGEYEEIK